MAEFETYDEPGFRSRSMKLARVSYRGNTYEVRHGIYDDGTLKGETVIASINGLETKHFSMQEVEHIYNQIGGK